jgi:hypothetical protein
MRYSEADQSQLASGAASVGKAGAEAFGLANHSDSSSKLPAVDSSSATPSVPATAIVRISIPTQNVQKSIRVQTDELVWVTKMTIIDKMAKGVADALNYGIYQPGKEGKEGKFMEESRVIGEYRIDNDVNILLRRFLFLSLSPR